MSTFHGIGLWPAADLTAPAVVELTKQADEAGLHSVWISELYYGRDAISLAAAVAVTTSRIKVATGVVNPYTRHPALLAMTYATLSELAPGRVVFGIGTCEPNWAEDMGYDFSRPRTAVDETLHVFEELFTKRKVHLEGKEVTLRNARFMFREVPPKPDVVVAAVGPRMCALAAEKGHGVLLSLGGSELPRVVRERLGDVPEEFIIAMTIPLAIGGDEALDHVRHTVAGLLAVPEGEAILAMSGLDPAGAQQVREDIRDHGFRGACAKVPADTVRQLAIVGTESECIDRIAEFVDNGVTLPVLQVGTAHSQESVALLAKAQEQLR